MNTPVPQDYQPAHVHIGLLRGILGYSYVAKLVAAALGRSDDWILDQREYIHAHRDGEAVSCLIMAKLSEFSQESGVRIIVFAMHTSDDLLTESGYVGPPTTTLLASGLSVQNCARNAGLEVIDSFEVLRIQFEDLTDINDPARKGFWLTSSPHHTPAGNELVADLLIREGRLREWKIPAN